MNSNLRISDEEVKNAPLLFVEEVSGNLFSTQKILKINAKGLISGGRNENDGVVIFCQKKSEQNDSKNLFKPDFELNYEQNLPYPYIFAIYYNHEIKKYFIRAFSGIGKDNRIMFHKISIGEKFPIKEKEIISAGNIIFLISKVNDNNLEIVNLSKKELSPMPKQLFDASRQKIVKIGRNKDCDFSFPKDKSFSRIQTTFEYDEELKLWNIYDGNKVKSSTNGTWIFGTHSFELKGEMTFKILNSTINISEVSNKELFE